MGRAMMAAGQGDAVLLAAARRGEHAAFGVLVERYQDLVCAVTYSRTRDAALSEDVAQETFIAAWRQLDQVREPNRLRSWLCGIAANLSKKARRQAARETLVDPTASAFGDVEGAGLDNPFDVLAQVQTERLVSAAIARVPETYRDVLVLYYREERSARDVAQLLDLSEAAVLQRLARGRQCLAAGIAALVETSLRSRRVRRDLAGSVLALIGVAAVTAPSRVEASTPNSKGTSMFKIAALVAALGAAGTVTAYTVHARSSAAPTARAAAAPPALLAGPAPVTAPVLAPSPTANPPARGAAPANTPAAPTAEARMAPPDGEAFDAATLAALHAEVGPSRGPASAAVTVVVFTDLLCSYCGDALGTLDQLVDEYPGELRIVAKQLPIHAAAQLPAEAVLAADAQGKFWELHDAILAHQDDVSRDALIAMATEQHLDVAAFTAALDHHTFAGAVAQDVAAAKALDVEAAPAFLINGRRVTGNVPIAELRAQIDAALAAQ